MKRVALDLGIKVFTPGSLAEFAAECAIERYDLFVLASFGRILPKQLLDVPTLGSLNVHPSLLPQYRGATPLQTALRDGAVETGVTIMLMDAGMDTGDVVLQERTTIRDGEIYGDLHDRLAERGAVILGRALDLARAGALPHSPQHGEAGATRPLKKEDLFIDWNWPAARIANAVRAFSPRPGARAILGGCSVKLEGVRPRDSKPGTSVSPGDIAGSSGDAAIVACADGAVEIARLTPANRAAMNGADFVRWLANRGSP